MTRFLLGKMLMFAKLFLMSFIYELVETFHFPSNTVKQIYQKYLIIKVFIYHVLTDTDCVFLKFILVYEYIHMKGEMNSYRFEISN